MHRSPRGVLHQRRRQRHRRRGLAAAQGEDADQAARPRARAPPPCRAGRRAAVGGAGPGLRPQQPPSGDIRGPARARLDRAGRQPLPGAARRTDPAQPRGPGPDRRGRLRRARRRGARAGRARRLSLGPRGLRRRAAAGGPLRGLEPGAARFPRPAPPRPGGRAGRAGAGFRAAPGGCQPARAAVTADELRRPRARAGRGRDAAARREAPHPDRSRRLRQDPAGAAARRAASARTLPTGSGRSSWRRSESPSWSGRRSLRRWTRGWPPTGRRRSPSPGTSAIAGCCSCSTTASTSSRRSRASPRLCSATART